MKRYTIIGEPVFDFIEDKEGDVVFYEDVSSFLFAEIDKELEGLKNSPKMALSTREVFLKQMRKELKNLLK